MKINKYIAVAACAGLLCLSWLILGSKGYALSNFFPDENDATVTAGTPPDDIMVDVAYNTSGGLMAPSGVIRIYSTSQTSNISIISANTGHGCKGDTAGARNTDYSLFYLDNNGNQNYVDEIDTTRMGSACNFDFVPSPSAPLLTIGDKQFYVYSLFYSDMDGAGAGGAVNAFEVQTFAGITTYVGLDAVKGVRNSKFSLQDRQPTPDPGCSTSNCRRSTYSLYFGTSCSVSTTETQVITWFDDDAGVGNLEGNNPSGQHGIRIRLFDETDGAAVNIDTPHRVHDPDGSNIADFGPSVEGTTNGIVFKANHKYRMDWEQVGKLNGIQFQLPYDGVYHDVQCGNPPRGVIDIADCTVLSGWAADQDFPNGSVKIDVWKDGPVGAGTFVNQTVADQPVSGNPDALANGNHGFSIDVSTLGINDFSTHQLYVYIRGLDSSGNDDATVNNNFNFAEYVQMATSPRTVGPCSKVACGSLETSVGAPESGQAFTVTAHFVYAQGGSNNALASPPAKMVVKGPGLFSDQTVNFTVDTNTGDGESPPIAATGVTAGVYTVTWNVQAGNPLQNLIATDCSGRIFVGDHPYFRVYNGDILSGGGFDGNTPAGTNPFSGAVNTSCATQRAPTATIKAFNDGAGKGSAAQFVAQALGDIDGFTTSTGHITGAFQLAQSLSYSNTQGDSTYGGGYGTAPCISDYFGYRDQMVAAGKITNLPLPSVLDTNVLALANVVLDSLGNPIKYLSYVPSVPPSTQNLDINPLLNGAIGVGQKVAVFVDGDVVLSHNIVYAGANSGWATEDDIPTFYLIVRGNIYIQPGVTQLDGVYIAIPEKDNNNKRATDTTGTYNASTADPASGIIYTCANGKDVSSPVFALFVSTSCKNRLVFNGAVGAAQVRLLRSIGKMSASASGETLGGSGAAEVFNGSPEVFLGSPFLPPANAPTFDSIGSFAPNL